MTTSTKTVLGIVAVAVIALGGIYAYRAHIMSERTASNTETGLPTSANDTSDSAIQQDAEAIDAQLQTTNADNASVDESIQTHSQVQ
ncbi:MAG: hypothetical protein JWN49_321 [Parcubacteria group bacterium]|nr:hypothetical protein [Parcubacteria group bacterium]